MLTKCENCRSKFKKNLETGDLCPSCKKAKQEGDREAGAARQMSIIVFGINEDTNGF